MRAPAALVVIATLSAAHAAAGDTASPALNQQACTAQTAAGVPASRLAALARGFNLPGWLEGATPRRPDMAVLARLHARGFTHIRLPVGAERLMDEFSTGGDVAQQLAELDFAIERLTRLGFAVSIDMHPGDKFGHLHVTQPERAYGLLESLWRTLARRYAGRSPDRVFFEALNEPAVNWTIWNDQGPRLAAAIRREAPFHTIIMGHPDYQRVDALPAVTPLADANVVYAAHFYDPMIFTHQGLDWSDDPLRFLRKVPFPARLTDPPVTRLIDELTRQGRDNAAAMVKTALREPWTEERIGLEVARAATWVERHQRPVIINEFGALGWHADPSDRSRWLRAVRSAAERACIGWAHWDYADGFGFVRRVADRETPDETIVRALLDGGAKSSPAASAQPAR
jgi:endoglucanase